MIESSHPEINRAFLESLAITETRVLAVQTFYGRFRPRIHVQGREISLIWSRADSMTQAGSQSSKSLGHWSSR